MGPARLAVRPRVHGGRVTGSVRFGYEVGTGKPVEIPIHHMVITGQTQMAGKTTALEALVARSGVQAVAFITKRGEGSFGDARIIRPYFEEHTDWKFVAAVLEASRGEKLKFERPWIVRACKGARTLADVQKNVRKAMETAKGLAGDVYLMLNAYLEDVVPQIGRIKWADTVDLAPGVSAMDLTGVGTSMQHLIIRSTLDWVLEHGVDTVVVIPEAWNFIPQRYGTPVRLAAERYIRQGAGLGNYLWLDSQDIAGVDKAILKQVPVWILGVQRESNEVKRTLAQIPTGIKEPKPEAIATLKLGEFYVCHGTSITKTYAQPRWMGDAEAEAVARGLVPAAGATTRARMEKRLKPDPEIVEDDVTPERAEQLERENAELREQIADLRRRLENGKKPTQSRQPAPPPAPDMGKLTPMPSGPAVGDDLYETFKRRLIAEAPALLKVLAARPELQVEIERRTIVADGSTLPGRLALLLSEGFFDEPQGGNVVYNELTRRGTGIARPNVYRECDKLLSLGFLTKEATGYKAVSNMKVNVVER